MEPKIVDATYRVVVVGKHVQITEAIRTYVLEKVGKLEKLTDQIIDVTVALDTQKLEHSCVIVMNFIHFHIKVSASTDDLYSAIDKGIDRLKRLILKYKEKLKSHRFKDVSTVDIHVNVIQPLQDETKIVNEEIEAENALSKRGAYELHKIVAQETLPLKTLTHDEAIMKMEICEDPFLIFRSEEDQKIKVLYRRVDEQYGLVSVH